MAVTVNEFEVDKNTPPHLELISDKFKNKFFVRPTRDGFIFYEISIEKGRLAAALSGYHTSMKNALDAFLRWEAAQKKSKIKSRDDWADARQKEKQAEG